MYPQKPYLVRAFFEWIVDSQYTPYLLIDANYEGVMVPQEYVEDGEIVLNVSPMAVKNFNVTNKQIDFEARFAGNPMHISFPVKSVLAIYANENGRGMVFSVGEEDDDDDFPADDGEAGGSKSSDGKPNLKLVK